MAISARRQKEYLLMSVNSPLSTLDFDSLVVHFGDFDQFKRVTPCVSPAFIRPRGAAK